MRRAQTITAEVSIVPITLHRGGVQTRIRIRQGNEWGKSGSALLDTGSSKIVIAARLLPASAMVEPQYDAIVHFLARRIRARVVQCELELEMGGVSLPLNLLQVAVIEDSARLPNGVDAVMGMCSPLRVMTPTATFVDAYCVSCFEFNIYRRVLKLHASRRECAIPLLSPDQLAIVDSTSTNAHYALPTDRWPRVVFDTGANVSVVPSHDTALILDEQMLDLSNAVTWSQVTRINDGDGIGVVLGMDTLRAMDVLHFERSVEDPSTWGIVVQAHYR
jgi:hypothetical protein